MNPGLLGAWLVVAGASEPAIDAAVPLTPDSPLHLAVVAYALHVCEAVRVQVDHLGVSPDLLNGSVQWSLTGDPCRPRPTLKAVGEDAAGQRTRSLTIRPELGVWVRRPVAERVYAKGELVVGTWGVVPLQDVHGAPAQPGWETTRAVQPGEPLCAAVARPVPTVRDGQAVTIVVEKGAVRLEAPGVAMADAGLGETIDVINDLTQRRVRAVVAGPDEVVVP